jgi:hypothetical protein
MTTPSVKFLEQCTLPSLVRMNIDRVARCALLGKHSKFALFRQLDDKRNQIVHWHTIMETGTRADGSVINDECLTPPHFLVSNPRHGSAANSGS